MKRLIPLLLALSLLTGCAPDRSTEASATPPEMVPASQPIQEQELMGCLYYDRAEFTASVSEARQYEVDGIVRAGIIPHHLVAADMIAGFFSLAAQHPEAYDTVLLISPSHFPEHCQSDVVTSTADWNTPFGQLQTDTGFSRLLLEHSGIAAADNPKAVEFDHGVAGLVPYVRHYLPDAQISVCLLANKLSRDRLEQVWDAVEQYSREYNVLVVASVDFSHYLMPEEAARRDEETVRAVEAFDFPRILSFTDSNVDSPQALSTALQAMQRNGMDLYRLDHSSSVVQLPVSIDHPTYYEGITTYFVYAATAEGTS